MESNNEARAALAAEVATPPTSPEDRLLALLRHKGLRTDEVGDYGSGLIVNISSADGEYLYTLTISRTPGY